MQPEKDIVVARPAKARFPEIDLLRGMGVLLMISYHALFDLNFFWGMNFEMNSGIIWGIGRGTAALFVGLAGLSLMLGWRRKHSLQRMPIVKRGLIVVGMGMGITVVTWILFPAYTIWFGVLHLMGTAIILGTLFIERPMLTFVMGIGITLAGVLLSLPPFQAQLPFLLPFFPVTFSTFDYFPLLPWLGVFLLGMSAGNYFYPSGRQRYLIMVDLKNPILNGIASAGKKSLLIYFLHQPILIGIILAARMLL